MPKGSSKAKAPKAPVAAAQPARKAAPATRAPEQQSSEGRSREASPQVEVGVDRSNLVGVYVARRSFGYQGHELDRGRIFRMVGAQNDEKLVRLGYAAKYEQKSPPHECGHCGAKFTDLSTLNAHGDKRHRGPGRREVEASQVLGGASPAQIHRTVEQAEVLGDDDEVLEREERIENEVAPLHLDNTAASRAA